MCKTETDDLLVGIPSWKYGVLRRPWREHGHYDKWTWSNCAKHRGKRSWEREEYEVKLEPDDFIIVPSRLINF